VLCSNQSFWAGVRLSYLTRRAIGAEEPVVAQGSRVLLFRDPNQLSGLFLEASRQPGRTVRCAHTSKSPITPPLSPVDIVARLTGRPTGACQ
jgi:hypothetical protein